ncbi:MAG: phosphate signaling complex protein PhoU [Halobacteriales archaeon]
MARQDYQSQLDELRRDVLYMSEVVLDRLRMGLDALETKDEELAMDVIRGDHEVNELYLDLEQDCIDLLALQQPVASDLRFIAASFKIITDLERIADLATNLGEYAIEAERDAYPEVDIQGIGDATMAMVEDAMEAYGRDDVERTYQIAERDDRIDERCEDASRVILTDLLQAELDSDDDEAVERTFRDVSRMLLTIRDLERVGDHAVNIAARTLYMVESDDELIY